MNKQTPQQRYEESQNEKGNFQYKRRIPKAWFPKLDALIKRLKKE